MKSSRWLSPQSLRLGMEPKTPPISSFKTLSLSISTAIMNWLLSNDGLRQLTRGVASTHFVAMGFSPLTIRSEITKESRRLGTYKNQFTKAYRLRSKFGKEYYSHRLVTKLPNFPTKNVVPLHPQSPFFTKNAQKNQ